MAHSESYIVVRISKRKEDRSARKAAHGSWQQQEPGRQ